MQELPKGRTEAASIGFSFRFCLVQSLPSYWLFFLIKIEGRVIELPVNVFEHIKRLMGLCLQKDFTGEIVSIQKHEQYIIPSYENDAHAGKKMKIITDYQFSTVLYAGSAAFFIFLIAGLVFSIPAYFAVLSVLSIFLTSVILLIQDRTTMELASNALIIRRLLFKPVKISKDDILKIEVIKNPNRRFRRVIISLVIIALIFWAKGAIDTLSRSTAHDTVSYFIFRIFLQVTLVIFVTVLFYKWYIRSHYENFLKITSRTKREVTFYTSDPQELMNKLE